MALRSYCALNTLGRGAVAVVAIVSIGVVLTSAVAQPKRPSPSVTAFDETVRSWAAKHGVNRASVAVMRNDKLVFARGYGGRGASERVAVWSMSKPITAVCIATLVQDGKLRFDDPIGALLAPSFAKYGMPTDERMARITVAQLLTHRGGLPTSVGDNKFAPGAIQLLQQRSLSEATVDMLIPSILKLSLTQAPGTEHIYSNVGYLLLGQIIEAVTGNTYEAECGHRVLARAGVRSPKLDEKWGRLLHSTAGWGLSGPEYLAFVRLLVPRRNGPLTQTTHDWIRSTDGKWTNDRKTIAYTLGVRVRPVTNAPPYLFHGGGWLWRGKYSEKRGTMFVLANDSVAWFASYDGVHGDTDSESVTELQSALGRVAGQVSSWPQHDEFAAMGVGPIWIAR